MQCMTETLLTRALSRLQRGGSIECVFGMRWMAGGDALGWEARAAVA